MFSAIQAAVDSGRLERALKTLRRRFARLSRSAEAQGVVYGLVDADRLCQAIGEKFLSTEYPQELDPGVPREDWCAGRDVYIASTIYELGGHTPLIGDFVKAATGRDPILLLTHTCGGEPKDFAGALRRTGLAPEQIRRCGESSELGKLRWTVEKLLEFRPERIFLAQHHEDAVAVAAARPCLAPHVFFVHHADTQPCLGVHTPGLIHLDVTPFRYHHCRVAFGVQDSRYAPLVRDDQGCRPLSRWDGRAAPLVTATSGNPGKFTDGFNVETTIGLPEVVATLLSATGGRHVHIGPLNDHLATGFRKELAARNVDPSALTLVPRVDSIWQAMGNHSVDLYMNSFPRSGSMALVEVMGSGTPAAWHVRSPESCYEDTQIKYPEAPAWRTPGELVRLVSRAGSDWLAGQARAARANYEAVHTPACLERALSEEPPAAPPLPDHYCIWHHTRHLLRSWSDNATLTEGLGLPGPLHRPGNVGAAVRGMLGRTKLLFGGGRRPARRD